VSSDHCPSRFGAWSDAHALAWQYRHTLGAGLMLVVDRAVVCLAQRVRMNGQAEMEGVGCGN
jgi:hypothetical protein